MHPKVDEIRKKGPAHWKQPPIVFKNREIAKKRGLWNLFLPVDSAQVAGRKDEQFSSLGVGREISHAQSQTIV